MPAEALENPPAPNEVLIDAKKQYDAQIKQSKKRKAKSVKDWEDEFEIGGNEWYWKKIFESFGFKRDTKKEDELINTIYGIKSNKSNFVRQIQDDYYNIDTQKTLSTNVKLSQDVDNMIHKQRIRC